MTEASRRALQGMRDLSTLEWYVIPLLVFVLYIYTCEVKKARSSGNWDAVLAGLAVLGMDFVNETWNGWVFHLTQHSALWTTPGKTALRLMMGWNIEIMFMFAVAGVVYYNSLSPSRQDKILGIPNRWFWAMAYSAFAVFVECLLNIGGHLVWEYTYWSRSFSGIWLIFFFGYLHFFVVALWVIGMKSAKAKILTVGSIYSIAIVANLIAFGLLDWSY
jgi:hypothetical protein